MKYESLSALLHPLSYIVDKAESVVPLKILNVDQFEAIKKTATPSLISQSEQSGFSGKEGQVCFIRDENGNLSEVLAGLSSKIGIYAFAAIHDRIKAEFSSVFLGQIVFKVEATPPEEEATMAAIGWALASYRFDRYKKDRGQNGFPKLIWPENADRKRAAAIVEGLCLVRNLINLPSNDLGTNELSAVADELARHHRAAFNRIVDSDLLDKNFPMIYEVGRASPRRPQLIEVNWGDDSHPRITLVGKGVVFDTGGLDIKPPPFMLTMKKDMGGAAHVLGLAHIIMALKLPVRLRVLIAAAENSIGGESFRPGDILKSRKGLSVEVGDTDAEGRLVVADALTYACENAAKPDLLVDFCTLTGSARAALGYDIPAIFSNDDDLAETFKKTGLENDDPVWPLPLWQPYLKEMKSPVADINNIGSGKAGAIHGALFLQQFIEPSVKWVHIDCYAWEQSGKPGRPSGGADTGMRAVLRYIEQNILK
jgi:leucyl aminopeptidase